METKKPVLLLLVRHGQAQSNVARVLNSYPETQPMPLSEKGRKEVAHTAKELESIPIAAIFASPLARTQESAAIISERIKVPVSIDERLRETDFGIYNNEPIAKFYLRYPHFSMRNATSKESGVEGLDLVRIRIKEFLREIQDRYGGQTVVLVTHADIIHELLGIIEGKGRHRGSIVTGSLHKVALTENVILDEG